MTWLAGDTDCRGPCCETSERLGKTCDAGDAGKNGDNGEDGAGMVAEEHDSSYSYTYVYGLSGQELLRGRHGVF